MSQGHIFIIDDDPMIRFLVQEYLKAADFTVDAFGSGGEALTALAPSLPDLILLDLQMPQMNGFEVLEKLRADESTAHIPVLMLSANAADARSMSSLQPNGYLEKPFQMQELLAAVQANKAGSLSN